MSGLGHVRIDDRLIHGQIVASWISVLGTKTILVADDKAAADPLQSTLLQLAVPPNIQLKIMNVKDAAAYLASPEEAADKLLVILRDVAAALQLAEMGIVPETINVGNVSAAPGKAQLTKSVWLNEEDVGAFTKLAEKGIYLEIRVVPGEKGADLFSLLKK